jgi:hypothetical protein
MKFLSTLGNKREKETAKPPHTFTSLHGRQRIRFAFSSANNKNNRNKKRQKGSISRDSLGPFQTRSQNLRANLYVVPDVFFDQEAILENGNQVTYKNQKLGSLVDSRRGGGAILVLVRSTNGTGEGPQFAPRVFWRWCAGSAGYSRTGSLAKSPPGPTRLG